MLIPETEIVVTKDEMELGRTTVRPGDYVIGRDPSADIIIDDALISPRHAQLTVNYHELFIEDLGSSSGTFVAGNPVNGVTRVWPHQKLQLGTVVLETRRLKAAEDTDESLAPETATLRRMLPEEFLRDHKYEISGVVARGGMGAILGAHELTIDRKVAMKVMLSTGSATDLLRFVSEAKITGKLEHPNIVPVHELGVDENEQVFYTMKFVEGKTLKKVLELLRQGFPGVDEEYPLTTLLTIFQKICDAIAFAHSKGVIHRDLKPDNVMLGAYGEVLVMDWGLAKARTPLTTASAREPQSVAAFPNTPAGMDDAPAADDPLHADATIAATMAGTVLGTPHYMSPEQAHGAVDTLDERTDIYALGAILYQILALRPPVEGERQLEILENVRAARIAPLTGARADHDRERGAFRHLPGGRIPASLGAVAMKALALDPANRYPTVQDLQAEITRFQSGFATTAEDAGPLKQVGLLVARHRREATILFASFVALLALGFAAFTHISHERNVATRARATAEAERERAKEALADLRKSAPAYYGQARALVDEQQFDEAIQNIGFALRLEPNHPDYRLFRAHTLAAMQRLPEAIEDYRRVLSVRSHDASAKMNLELCERLLQRNGGKLPLAPERQHELLDAIIAQKRSADSVLIARALGRNAEVATARIRTRLKSIITQERWSDARLEALADGSCSLNLSDLHVPDLSLLRDLPISALQLANCGAKDLASLASLPLRELNIDGLQVRDLSPLKGLPLQKLSARDSSIEDLQLLTGMPLRELAISRTAASDLAPLAGIPLRSLNADSAPVRSLEPLRGMQLDHLSLRACGVEAIDALASMPLRSVNLSNNPISDLSPLAGCQTLRSLAVSNSRVRDLRPLARLKLTELQLSRTLVTDLSPLRGMPLRQLMVDHSPIVDASPLLTCSSLEDLTVSSDTPNVSALRRLPKLAYVSEESDGHEQRTRQRAHQFWTLFDAGAPDRAREGKIKAALAHFRGLPGWRENRFETKPDGTCRLNLNKLPINDVATLHGLPISDLDISSTGVTDLLPLAKCPLRVLVCYRTPLQDLAPLRGMALEKLDAGDTKVRDLRPVQGMPLRWLSVRSAQVSDLAPLEGMPLQVVNIGNLKGVSDLKPIRNAPLTELQVDNTGISDLKAIAGCATIEKINVSLTEVSDLSPLMGRKLTMIHVVGTKVRSLATLRGMPIRVMHADFTEITDLSPLADCTALEEFLIPAGAKDVSPLRKLPNLRSVSYRRPPNGFVPAQTAAEFWAEIDGRTAAVASDQAAPAFIDPNWSNSYEYDSGIAPAIATNVGRPGPNSTGGKGLLRLAIAVHQTQAGAGPLRYRVGRVNGLRVEWGESVQYEESAAQPSIAIGEETVVAVHQATAHIGELSYRVGQVRSSRSKGFVLSWGDTFKLAPAGAQPSVAMWGNHVVSVHQAGGGLGPLVYRLGRINGLRIDWSESTPFETSGLRPVVAIADQTVVAVYQTSNGVGPLALRTGRINGARIDWSDRVTYDSGGLRPSIGIFGQEILALHQTGDTLGPINARAGKISGTEISWGASRGFEPTALQPSVALGDNLAAVVQQAQPNVGALWYRLGTYRAEPATSSP